MEKSNKHGQGHRVSLECIWVKSRKSFLPVYILNHELNDYQQAQVSHHDFFPDTSELLDGWPATVDSFKSRSIVYPLLLSTATLISISRGTTIVYYIFPTNYNYCICTRDIEVESFLFLLLPLLVSCIK